MTVQLRNGSQVEDPRLDRLPSVRTDHLEKYPLTAASLTDAINHPMLIGVNWYSNFDSPVLRRVRGHDYHVIGDGNLGYVRGGHATCLRPWHLYETDSWWPFYDQGQEGRCAEFGGLRVLSLLNRKKYDITTRWHYWMAQENDEWPGGSYPGASPVYEGTSVRAMLEVFRTYGAVPARWQGRPFFQPFDASKEVKPEEGIAAYRWATDWNDVRTVLNVPSWLPGVPLLNSWGRSYPHQVLLLDAAGERLLKEDGEFGVVTDR